MLGWLFSPLRVGFLAVALAAAAVVGLQLKQGHEAKQELAGVRAELAAAHADLAASEIENARARARHARDLGRVQRVIETERARSAEAEALLEQIERAPPEADGPVADVLRDTLKALP